MKALRIVALVSLTLSLPAWGRDLASAEDRPGRVTLTPFSLAWPSGEGWVLLQRGENSVTFSRQPEGSGRSFMARMYAQVPGKRIGSTQELEERLRSDLREKIDQERFRVVAEEVQADVGSPLKCVRYYHRAEDRQPARQEEALAIDLRGRSCLHPDDEGIVVGMSFAERGPASLSAKEVAALAARFFSGIRFHAPLTGEGWRAPARLGDANAQVWLGRHLLRSERLEEGVAWLRRAADAGHSEARALLGLAHLTGRGVARSAPDAVRMLRPAAENDYPKAAGLLGLALITAEEVRNTEEGLRWTRKAAEQGDALAQSLLGELYLFGRGGLEKREAEGAAWYRKAAEQGDAQAQANLARLLAEGVGVKQNALLARFWLELAAAQGHAEARKSLEGMKQPPRSEDK